MKLRNKRIHWPTTATHTAQKLVNGQEGSSTGNGSRNFTDKVILKMDFEERGQL